jgi:endonuclease YncB( thermonuclease family)
MRLVRILVTLLVLLALAAAGCGSTATPAAMPHGSAPPDGPAASPSSGAATTTRPTAVPSGGPTAGPGGLAPTGPTEEARVVRVVDGDTIIVDRGRGAERLRYIGMDTPETVKPASPVEWMGAEASAANRSLVEGQTVVLEKDVSETDRYGRLLRDVWLHGGGSWRLVNLELVRDGYARVSTYPPDVKYVDLLLTAQVDAREHDRGLWGAGPLDFLDPEDGATVTTKTIVVRGTAPAGSRIVRDIANAPDQDTRAAADGSWSMAVTLKRGINDLRFRIGDEKATTRVLRIVYAP